MTLLDRYILKQFTRHLGLTLCSLMSIYLLIDFFERIDNFLEAGQTTGLAIRYLLLKAPLIAEQLLPICILLAGVITLGLLNHSRELLALQAGGICITRTIKPLIGGGLFFTLLALANSQWLMPPTISASNAIWLTEVKNERAHGIERHGRIFYRGQQGIYSFSRSTSEENAFLSFNYSAWDKTYQPVTIITAESATYLDGYWTFHKGQIKKRLTSGEFQTRIFERTTLPLPDNPKEFFARRYGANELSLTQLHRRTRTQHDTDQKDLINFHQRLSYLFLGLPLLILGLPILMIVHRRWGRDLTLAIPISCGLAFAAWGWWSASQALAKAAYIQPGLSAWFMHFLALTLGSILIRHQDR